jgi:hypothetical protein
MAQHVNYSIIPSGRNGMMMMMQEQRTPTSA